MINSNSTISFSNVFKMIAESQDSFKKILFNNKVFAQSIERFINQYWNNKCIIQHEKMDIISVNDINISDSKIIAVISSQYKECPLYVVIGYDLLGMLYDLFFFNGKKYSFSNTHLTNIEKSIIFEIINIFIFAHLNSVFDDDFCNKLFLEKVLFSSHDNFLQGDYIVNNLFSFQGNTEFKMYFNIYMPYILLDLFFSKEKENNLDNGDKGIFTNFIFETQIQIDAFLESTILLQKINNLSIGEVLMLDDIAISDVIIMSHGKKIAKGVLGRADENLAVSISNLYK